MPSKRAMTFRSGRMPDDRADRISAPHRSIPAPPGLSCGPAVSLHYPSILSSVRDRYDQKLLKPYSKLTTSKVSNTRGLFGLFKNTVQEHSEHLFHSAVGAGRLINVQA